jgi:hypothetical protein
MTRWLVVLLTLAVCACRDHRPPAPTAEQSQQLNEADRLLNELANEEGPEANAPGPSNSSD